MVMAATKPDDFTVFLGNLAEMLRTYARMQEREEMRIFEYVWEHRGLASQAGYDLVEIFDKVRDEFDVQWSIAQRNRFSQWMRVRGAVPVDVVDRIPTKTAAHLSRFVADDKDLPRAAQSVVQNRAGTYAQVQRVVADLGVTAPARPAKKPKPAPMRRQVQKWLTMVKSAEKARTHKTAKERIEKLRAEMEGWLREAK